MPQIEVVQGSFKPNATLVATLVDFDIPSELAQSVARLVQPVFDVRGFRSGNAFTLEKDTDGTLRAFEYKISDDKILEVQRGADAYEARVSSLDLESRETTITSEITPAQNSLYAALAKEDRQAVQLAEKVASIFAWDVDFNSGLQPDDRIRIVVPALYHEGQFVKWGDIQAAELLNSGKTYRAFRYEGSYYDTKGNALKRALLASPSAVQSSDYLRILKTASASDSGYQASASRRRLRCSDRDTGAGRGKGHRDLRRLGRRVWESGSDQALRWAHYRICAPVEDCRWGPRWESSVDQGEGVGSVGQTGLATGPHLHFMMTKDGRPINPRSLQSEPPIPIDSELTSVVPCAHRPYGSEAGDCSAYRAKAVENRYRTNSVNVPELAFTKSQQFFELADVRHRLLASEVFADVSSRFAVDRLSTAAAGRCRFLPRR